MTVTYTVGDTREVIKGIPDGSVDLIATSPPFLALRSYVPADHESKGDEIGSEANPAAFIDMLLGLTAEWGRVLAPHGSIAIELGDTYSGSGGAGGDYNADGLREGQQKFSGSAKKRAENNVGDEYRPSRSGRGDAWPRAKSLALIPQLYAVALAYGINPLTGAPSPAGRWLVRNVIVWHRPNPAVGALGDKVRPSTSYIVIATRSKDRWFDLTAVRSGTVGRDDTPMGWTGQREAARVETGLSSGNGWTGLNPAGAPPLDCWFDEYDGTHDTWTLTTQPSKLCHYAMWPAKLAERLILSMCPSAVCRVCGEPRRRMERTTHHITQLVMSKHPASPSRGGEMGRAASTNVDTLGWSDCGCQCPTCEGRGLMMLGGGVGICVTCSDGRAFRPGVTLDPFAGSGTTLAVADLHGRDAIGIDFDARNKAIYPARYDEVKRALYGTPAPMPGQGDLFAEVVAG